ncbi:hypothetical protein [Gorillibacterium timonense]|uniref:hypothetical protein n=1 Tax=Gorillibacterium timonense TaxID=1689269 RepID=UPI00071C3896|nr:hypothetical protein [Gorillibacterium timonense]
MKESIRLPLGVALAGFVFTFFLSLSRNILSTSLIRGLLSAALLFLLGLAVKWILGVLSAPPAPNLSDALRDMPDDQNDVGRSLDLTTPAEDDELNRLIMHQEPAEPSFEPLKPPKLTTKTEQSAQHLADALRTMSEE